MSLLAKNSRLLRSTLAALTIAALGLAVPTATASAAPITWLSLGGPAKGTVTLDLHLATGSSAGIAQVCFRVNGATSNLSNDLGTIIFSNNGEQQQNLNAASCFVNVDKGQNLGISQSIDVLVQADTTPWPNGTYTIVPVVTDSDGHVVTGPSESLTTVNSGPRAAWVTPPATVSGKIKISLNVAAARPGTAVIAEVCFVVNGAVKRLNGDFVKVTYSNGGWWDLAMPGAIGENTGAQVPKNSCVSNIDSTYPQNFIGISGAVVMEITLDTTAWPNGHYSVTPVITDSYGRTRNGNSLVVTTHNGGPSMGWLTKGAAISHKTTLHLNVAASATGSANVNQICIDTPTHPAVLTNDLAFIDFTNGGRRQVFLTSLGCLPQPISAVPNSPSVSGLDLTVNPTTWSNGTYPLVPTAWDSNNRHSTGAVLTLTYKAPPTAAPHVLRTFCNTTEKIIYNATSTQYRWTYVYVYVWSDHNVTQGPAQFILGPTRPC